MVAAVCASCVIVVVVVGPCGACGVVLVDAFQGGAWLCTRRVRFVGPCEDFVTLSHWARLFLAYMCECVCCRGFPIGFG